MAPGLFPSFGAAIILDRFLGIISLWDDNGADGIITVSSSVKWCLRITSSPQPALLETPVSLPCSTVPSSIGYLFVLGMLALARSFGATWSSFESICFQSYILDDSNASSLTWTHKQSGNPALEGRELDRTEAFAGLPIGWYVFLGGGYRSRMGTRMLIGWIVCRPDQRQPHRHFGDDVVNTNWHFVYHCYVKMDATSRLW